MAGLCARHPLCLSTFAFASLMFVVTMRRTAPLPGNPAASKEKSEHEPTTLWFCAGV